MTALFLIVGALKNGKNHVFSQDLKYMLRMRGVHNSPYTCAVTFTYHCSFNFFLKNNNGLIPPFNKSF